MNEWESTQNTAIYILSLRLTLLDVDEIFYDGGLSFFLTSISIYRDQHQLGAKFTGKIRHAERRLGKKLDPKKREEEAGKIFLGIN